MEAMMPPEPKTTALNGEAEQLLERMQIAPPREAGEKLRPIDEATILELAAAGRSQVEIAGIVGCHQSTVSRTLADWADSRGLARKYAEAKSLEMMKRFVADASPAEILKMQQKLDVVRDERQDGGGLARVLVVNQPGHLIIEPPTRTLSPRGTD
jgi:hypothetical protein